MGQEVPTDRRVASRRRVPAEIGVFLANGRFVAQVFVLHPRKRIGAAGAGWVRLSRSPALEHTATFGLVAGWSMQMVSLIRRSPRRHRLSVRRQLAAGLLLAASHRVAIAAQDALGPAWRTSVTGTGLTPLITSGPYRVIRHPVYSAMAGLLLANALVGSDRLALAGGALAFAALELQVRRVEEPALRSAYGDLYQQYAATTGRFVPSLGWMVRGGSAVVERFDGDVVVRMTRARR